MKPYTLVFSFLLISLSACQPDKPTQTSTDQPPLAEESVVELTESQYRNARLKTASLVQRVMRRSIQVNGSLSTPPQQMVSVSVPLGGYLKSTTLIPGTPVRKGQVLAIIEDQQYISLQQDYLTAKARMVFLEKELERQQELNQNKVNSDKVWQQTQADYSIQQATLRGLSERLQLIGIRPETVEASRFSRSISLVSPLDGYVTQVNAHVGKYIQPNETLMELVNPTQLLATLVVFERDLNSLRIGQPVVLTLPALANQRINGKIRFLNRSLDQNRSIEAICELTSSVAGLLPGMFVSATIASESDLQPTLPEAAVVRFQNKYYTFVEMSERKYQLVAVQTGLSESGFINVSVPPQYQGAKFVTQNAYTLLMKLKNSAEEE